jgi:signal transduction histidine kinase
LPYDQSAADMEHIDALEREIRVLRNLETARIQFLTLVSHELRTPLTSILTYAEALGEGQLGPLAEGQRDALASIERAARQTLEMVQEILRYSKSGGQSAELRPETFPVAELVDELRSSHHSLLARKRLDFRTQIAEEAPPLRADRAKVVHALGNLLSNAIEFTPEGGRIEVRAESEEVGSWLRIEVLDTGIGIAPEDQDRIFEEFVSMDRGVERRLGGSGLGLSIARRIVEMHGGELGLDSSPGEGSRFYLTLPTSSTRPGVTAGHGSRGRPGS